MEVLLSYKKGGLKYERQPIKNSTKSPIFLNNYWVKRSPTFDLKEI